MNYNSVFSICVVTLPSFLEPQSWPSQPPLRLEFSVSHCTWMELQNHQKLLSSLAVVTLWSQVLPQTHHSASPKDTPGPHHQHQEEKKRKENHNSKHQRSLCCVPPVTMIKTLTKTNVGRKGFIWLTGDSSSSTEAKTRTQSRTQEACPTNANRTIRWRKFLSFGSLFPGDSSLNQVDKNLQKPQLTEYVLPLTFSDTSFPFLLHPASPPARKLPSTKLTPVFKDGWCLHDSDGGRNFRRKLQMEEMHPHHQQAVVGAAQQGTDFRMH